MTETVRLEGRSGPEVFYHESLAMKAVEVLQYVLAIKCTVVETTDSGKPAWALEYVPEERDKVERYRREIDAVLGVVRSFQVGPAFPTQMLAEDSRFPTEMINPDSSD